jgi:hypothetical protein
MFLPNPVPLPEGLDIPAEDWQQIPTSVRHPFLSLLKRVDVLEARLPHDPSDASRPPSTDSLTKKRARRTQAAERRKPGTKPGHSTARRKYLPRLQHRMVHHNNHFPRAKLARQLAVRSTGAQH